MYETGEVLAAAASGAGCREAAGAALAGGDGCAAAEGAGDAAGDAAIGTGTGMGASNRGATLAWDAATV